VSDWPAPIAEQALHGPAGEFVRLIEPHTEADPIALLIQLLVAFGVAAGRHAHLRIAASRHYPNEFWCAARRLVVSPAQPGVNRKEVTGSNGLPGSER
jgi:hypothetical protein